ncbi:MAG: virulence RhuM family protein [Paramuribaculum sp.]|nr:virulence RhuM family protein [Paramuribaculum sp.]
MDRGQIILFQSQSGDAKIEVRLANESVWLTADQMAELFQRNKSTISRHIKNIYESGELEQNRTVAFFATVQNEGDRKVERSIAYYNLDMIISVGYRVNSHRGVQFRQWATQVLKEYMIKGFALCFRKCKIRDRGQIILFQSQGGDTFQRNKSTISRHIRNVIESADDAGKSGRAGDGCARNNHALCIMHRASLQYFGGFGALTEDVEAGSYGID